MSSLFLAGSVSLPDEVVSGGTKIYSDKDAISLRSILILSSFINLLSQQLLRKSFPQQNFVFVQFRLYAELIITS
jgi:hypothetical protein